MGNKRKLIQSTLRSQRQYKSLLRALKNRPLPLPSNPNRHYEQFINWGDWLGTGRYHGGFLPYEEARAFTQKFNLKSFREWQKWSKHSRPPNIPSVPNEYYKEWKNWGDWLGTGRHKNGFLPFEEGRAFTQKLKLKSQRGWKKWCKHSRPSNIPYDPHKHYKEWQGWRDWLGTKFLPYEEAREFARKLNLKSRREWVKWCKHKPSNMPSAPNEHYKEWENWGDWLGTGRHKNGFLPYEEGRAFTQKLKLKSLREWHKWSKHSRPSSIPSSPHKHYKEWVGWGDFLGTQRQKRNTEERLIIENVEKAA